MQVSFCSTLVIGHKRLEFHFHSLFSFLFWNMPFSIKLCNGTIEFECQVRITLYVSTVVTNEFKWTKRW